MIRFPLLGFVLVGCTGLLHAQEATAPALTVPPGMPAATGDQDVLIEDNDSSPLHAALLAYKSGKYDQARTAIDAAEKANPGDLRTELLKAKILTEQHDYTGGEKLLRGLLPKSGTPEWAALATAQGPELARLLEIQTALGDLLLRKHSFDRAATWYGNVLKSKPSDPDLTLKLIYAKIGSADLVGAGQLASNLKPIDPKNPYDPHASYYFAKAALAQAQNNTQGAEDNIEEARTIYGNTITDRYLKTFLEVFAHPDKTPSSDLTPAPLVKPAPSGAK